MSFLLIHVAIIVTPVKCTTTIIVLVLDPHGAGRFAGTALTFQAGTAKNLSLMDFDESKTKYALPSWKPIFLFLELYFQAKKKNFEWKISKPVRALDLNQKLQARPKYQLSSITECPHVLLLYLLWLRFVYLSTTCQRDSSPNGLRSLLGWLFLPLQSSKKITKFLVAFSMIFFCKIPMPKLATVPKIS